MFNQYYVTFNLIKIWVLWICPLLDSFTLFSSMLVCVHACLAPHHMPIIKIKSLFLGNLLEVFLHCKSSLIVYFFVWIFNQTSDKPIVQTKRTLHGTHTNCIVDLHWKSLCLHQNVISDIYHRRRYQGKHIPDTQVLTFLDFVRIRRKCVKGWTDEYTENWTNDILLAWF